MDIEVQIETSTYNKLKDFSEPFETLDQLLLRLLKTNDGPRPQYKGKKIGRAIKALIRQSFTNEEIYAQVIVAFPGTRIKSPREITHYRSVMKKEARDKRKSKKR